VSEAEGTVLGFILRRQPVTRYQILRAFQTSPFTRVNTSKGSLYPLVRRLVERKLVAGKPGTGTRETEVLELTERGHEALRRWVKSVRLDHVLRYDPLKFRAVSLGELSRAERIQWVGEAKQLLWRRREELEAYRARIRLPYQDVLNPADDAIFHGQLKWLDRLLVMIANEEEPDGRAYYDWEGEKL
jgi:DNA-binding PadR family transcriptional regulator